MTDKYLDVEKTTSLTKDMIKVALIGGTFGAVAGFMIGIVINPARGALIGAVSGACIGMAIRVLTGILKHENKVVKNNGYMNELKLKLREEQLRLLKRWTQTGEVSIHKEIFEEEKNIVVPITREEIVIEKKIINKENAENKSETIRIPISEEHIEVIKHPVALEDVSIFKHQFKEIKHIEDKLKKERIVVKTSEKNK